ncbi:MAG: ATP-binding cassette domain-containing protein [Alphaproteobacteria bacterium]|nr:ATP-binding cassette domain-containing protein [Alphaproteobacteria bacterium]
MKHNPIIINNLDLILPHKICFQNFSAIISYGDRIAIIGRNGSGKSALLNYIHSSNLIKLPNNAVLGYVPQIIDGFNNLSGGERFNKYLTQCMQKNPNVLLLDEPSNHLDRHNFQSLTKMLNNYQGTLIIASHNKDLLNACNILWHIDGGKITIFHGNYSNYVNKLQQNRDSLSQNLKNLRKQKREVHESLMKEQIRTAKSKAKGQKNIADKKWTKMAGGLKTSESQNSQGKKFKNIEADMQNIADDLRNIRLPEVILPKFTMAENNTANTAVLQINNGKIYYKNGFSIHNINLTLQGRAKLAITGRNGSGKSSLLRAIINKDTNIIREGNWFTPAVADIGYLSQHYDNLNLYDSVIANIECLVPQWTMLELRDYLNSFLFSKNEEVNARAITLSGGEKARLSLAKIILNPPKLLLLDEITNNLDLETIEYVAGVLRNYQGAMIIVSHDDNFLAEIGIVDFYKI